MYVPRHLSILSVVAAGILLWGCGRSANFVAQYEPWREQEERACLVSGHVHEAPWLQSRNALGGPDSYCGAMKPFEMAGAADGRVSMKPSAMLRCNMIPSVERWIRNTVEPEVRRHYGVPLVEVKVASSYSCRPRNNQAGAKLSEHGHANAIDVSGFHLADGRLITVKGGWRGDGRDRSFLRAVHTGACREFTTILGPEADSFHQDHFHLDLARHGRTGDQVICR
jgi:hypothetical protein